MGINSSTSDWPFDVRLIATVRALSSSRLRVTRPLRFIALIRRDIVDISVVVTAARSINR
jgi:hypothetical protein